MAHGQPLPGIHAAVVRYGEPAGLGVHVDVCTMDELPAARAEAGTDLISLIGSIDQDTAEAVRRALQPFELDGSRGRREITPLVRLLLQDVLTDGQNEAA